MPAVAPKACLACALIASACGAAGETAPAYVEPSCPAFETQLTGLRGLLETGRLDGLRRALEAGLSERATAGLVDLIAAALRALPDARFGPLVGPSAHAAIAELEPALGAALDALTTSPDVAVVGPLVGRVLSDCGTAPLLEALAGVLDSPHLPRLVAAARAVAADASLGTAIERGLFTGDAQRQGFPAVVLPILCLAALPSSDLTEVRDVFRPYLGDLLDTPPLSDLLDAFLLAAAPGTDMRHAAAPWAACYVARPAGEGAYTCPQPLPAPAPDPQLVLLAVLWDALASDAATAWVAAAGPQPAVSEPTWATAVAAWLRVLAADATAERAWPDLATALLAPEHAAAVTEDLGRLLRTGGASEVLDVLTALEEACPAGPP